MNKRDQIILGYEIERERQKREGTYNENLKYQLNRQYPDSSLNIPVARQKRLPKNYIVENGLVFMNGFCLGYEK